MEVEALIGLLVAAAFFGACAGLWVADREIERLEERLLELERQQHMSNLDKIVDSIQREGF